MFKVNARTLIHLGAELISSDAVAFYEVIKNSFDAKSETVKIEVASRIDHDELEFVRELIAEQRSEADDLDDEELSEILDGICEQLTLDELDPDDTLAESLEMVGTLDELEAAVDAANYIEISDTGVGMSMQDLQDIYLTIGTPVRYKERQEMTGGAGDDERPILGEKGIGRLSVMRLGWKLQVRTTRAGDPHWHVLDIDWRAFNDVDKMIEDIEVAPRKGEKKEDRAVHGTVLHVSALAAGWSEDKLSQIAREQLSKFMDPFAAARGFPISLRFNGQIITVPRMQDLLFSHAHMKLTARYVVNEHQVHLEGLLSVKHAGVDRSTKIVRTTEQLQSITSFNEKVLRSLGPFELTMYWFNRRLLRAIDGIGDTKRVRELQGQWSGVMLFRDGFRIHPYGNQDDDWLDFDRTALGRGGYKLNKAQFIGKIDISRSRNSRLIDQSNREGLKDTPEKAALIEIVRSLVQTDVWMTMTAWEKETKKADPAKLIEEQLKRIEKQQESIRKNIAQLSKQTGDSALVESFDSFLKDSVGKSLSEAKRFVAAAQDERRIVLHLAGIGLMLEVVAHELKRTTTAALATMNKLLKPTVKSTDAAKQRRTLETLQAQLKNIEKRLRILDPHSTAGRNRKETFDVVAWTRSVLDTHAEQLTDLDIQYECVVVAPDPSVAWQAKMVKGIFVQIIENLVTNSIYWLKFEKKRKIKFKPKFRIELHPTEQAIKVIDNGPGIPFEQGDLVFEPFFTTRPPGESRGLGLYIARENADYNDLEINLSEKPVIHDGRYNTFVISWKKQ